MQVLHLARQLALDDLHTLNRTTLGSAGRGRHHLHSGVECSILCSEVAPSVRESSKGYPICLLHIGQRPFRLLKDITRVRCNRNVMVVPLPRTHKSSVFMKCPEARSLHTYKRGRPVCIRRGTRALKPAPFTSTKHCHPLAWLMMFIIAVLELSITKTCELFSTRLESFCRNGRNSPFGFRASSLASLFVRPAKTHALRAAVFDAPLADRLAFAIFARIDALLLKFPCMPGSFQSAKIYEGIRRATQGSSVPSRQNVAYASCTSLQCASPTPIRTGYGKSSTFTPPLTETSVKPAMSIDAVRPALRVTHMRRWTPRIASGGQDAGLWEQNPVWLHPCAAHGWCGES